MRSVFFLTLVYLKKKKILTLDWYIFDYKSEILGENLLGYFLKKVEIDKDLKAIYKRFGEGVFSIFEAIALRTGKEMLIHDLIKEKDYNVKDTTITREIFKGQCGFFTSTSF